MTRTRIVLWAGIGLWVALIVLSYVMSMRIDGPQNIDTGFQRLDVLAKWQIGAFFVACACAVLGIAWRKSGKWMLLMGFAPLLVTGALVLALVVMGMVLSARREAEILSPPPSNPTTAPAAEAMPLPTD